MIAFMVNAVRPTVAFPNVSAINAVDEGDRRPSLLMYLMLHTCLARFVFFSPQVITTSVPHLRFAFCI
jgi:hypothetical protein